MTTTDLLIFILGLVTYLLIRSGEIRIWHVTLTVLLGIYLDRAHWTDPVIYAVTWLVQGHAHTH